MDGIELRKPSKAFIEVAKVWHEDPELNYLVGFAKGKAGVKQAHAALDAFVPLPPPNARMYAIWVDEAPAGYTVLSDIDRGHKTADLHITLPRINQGRGLGPIALAETLDLAFDEGLFRITFKPIVGNKRAVEAAASIGFKVEARTKFSVWTESGPKDQVQMRMVKPEWLKRNRD